mmetsp:Transcript_10265/g.28293  ORF Transcript_10265/g.28293 Transcript_10265/m.28293 type:complete len:116 (+) Transcript_10265:589-936(+)
MLVDNAATSMMKQAVDRYCKQNPQELSIITNRDAAHCFYLITKDSSDLPCFKEELKEVTMFTNFTKTDRIEMGTHWGQRFFDCRWHQEIFEFHKLVGIVGSPFSLRAAEIAAKHM